MLQGIQVKWWLWSYDPFLILHAIIMHAPADATSSFSLARAFFERNLSSRLQEVWNTSMLVSWSPSMPCWYKNETCKCQSYHRISHSHMYIHTTWHVSNYIQQNKWFTINVIIGYLNDKPITNCLKRCKVRDKIPRALTLLLWRASLRSHTSGRFLEMKGLAYNRLPLLAWTPIASS